MTKYSRFIKTIQRYVVLIIFIEIYAKLIVHLTFQTCFFSRVKLILHVQYMLIMYSAASDNGSVHSDLYLQNVDFMGKNTSF